MATDRNNPGRRIDEPTGTETVGHEWDGIEELNTPLPRWWLWTFYATCAWAAVYVVLYPAWPMVNQATEGVLEWSSRGQLAKEMSAAELARRDTFERIAVTDIEKLPASPELMGQAIAGGAAAFKVNCVQCHGAGAAGYEEYGYPNLNDDAWIWGGTLEEIQYTLTHGIRWEGSNDTRLAYMPAFEGILDDAQIDAVASHVLSLSGKSPGNATGAQLFEQNCSVCHGTNGQGDPQQGAPALNDAIWLYGGDKDDIERQILAPRHGVMPGWSEKLDPVTIKMLAAYVHSRGGGQTVTEPVEEVIEDTMETSDEVAAATEDAEGANKARKNAQL